MSDLSTVWWWHSRRPDERGDINPTAEGTMPWSSKDAKKHTHKASSSTAKRQWSHVANSVLKSTGNEARAIREANAVVARRRKSK